MSEQNVELADGEQERSHAPFVPGYTGGQFSVARMVFALALLLGAVSASVSENDPRWLLLMLPAATLMVGLFARVSSAVALGLLGLFWLQGGAGYRFVFYSSPMLLAYLFAPSAPYLSWDARGRFDPRGNWRLPPAFVSSLATAVVFTVVVALIPGLSAELVDDSGDSRSVVLLGAVVAGALFCISPRGRFAAWCILGLCAHCVLWILPEATLFERFGLHVLVFAWQIALFDSRWCPPKTFSSAPIVLYDGGCALCHGFVRFLLAEDQRGVLRFAPLENAAEFDVRVEGIDSVMLKMPNGETFARTVAVRKMLDAIGGVWRPLAWGLRLCPRAIADRIYDAIAARRLRFFGTKAEACPVLPPDLRERFL